MVVSQTRTLAVTISTDTDRAVAPALRALLSGFLDYAGIYPPAKLPLEQAVQNYCRYKADGHAWMLRWFVLGAADCAKVPSNMDGALSVIGEIDESRAATMESTSVLTSVRPVYCEVALADLEQLEKVKASGNYAKIRTGGLKAEAIPSPSQVAAFIKACAKLNLPFKATAGLHHPIRAEQPLTYEANPPRAVLHGFINVLMAACFAYHGEENIEDSRYIEEILAETDARAFEFDSHAHYRERSLTISQVEEARRNFIHSVGSCSFEEPVEDLKALGLL